MLQAEHIHAAGIERADQAARAGTGDDVRCKAIGLQHFDDADVREASGSAAAERDADTQGHRSRGFQGRH